LDPLDSSTFLISQFYTTTFELSTEDFVVNELINLLSWICLLLGSFFAVSGGVGLLRFPDFFSRLHPAGMTDTLGAALILIGLMLQAGFNLISVKLIMILAFLLLTNPTATHALAKSALHGNQQPLTGPSIKR
jgi:multicomponent Na+:H+ antiporter subunit G